jgi:RNA polymerase sigma-70 factor, ECF subfamily
MNNPDAQTDQALVERVQRGDKRAFDMLVLRHQHKVLRLINGYIKDSHAAMDVAQETFIKAYRALGNFRGDSSFYTWLYRIAINTAKNYLVSQGRRPLLRSAGGDDDEDDGPSIDELVSDVETPEALLQRDQVQGAVAAAIAGLASELRAALLMRELEGMSYEEIAVALDCPIGTVRSRIFRAREAVANRLRRDFGEGMFRDAGTKGDRSGRVG